MPHAQRQGLRIYYESFGRGDAVVFLHPLATNRYFWVHQMFAFAREHRAIAVDHRGHGLSSRPASGYGIGEMGRDLVAVLDHARVEQAVLVGVSAGSMVALQTALDAPHRVSALVLVSVATNLAPNIPPEVRIAYRERFEAAFDAMLRGSLSDGTTRERPEVARFLADVIRVPDAFDAAVFQSCIADPDGVFDWNVAHRLGEICKPVLVIAGEEDRAMPLETIRALSAGIAGAEFRIAKGVGHYYPLERPAAFNDALAAFLRELG